MASTLRNESSCDKTRAPQPARAKTQPRRDDKDDLRDLALMSSQDESNLTPFDSVFGERVTWECDAKHIPMI